MRISKYRFGALAAAVALTGLMGCATRSDVDALQTEILAVRASQDSLARRVSAVERALQQGLDAQRSAVSDMRGDFQRRFQEIDRQLVQIQELLGQSQVVLRGLRERAQERESELSRPGGDTVGADTAAGEGRAGADEGGDAEALYNAAVEQFRRGAYGTARAGFEEFLSSHPAHELAPAAQLALADTYRETQDLERAVTEYDRVMELYPNSGSAPTALHRAGVVQLERGNKDSACEYFQRVVLGFPRSDESRLAREQRERLNCR